MQRFTRLSSYSILLPLLALHCALPKLTAIEGDGDGDSTTETNNSGGGSGDGDGDVSGDGDASGGDSNGSGGDSDGSGGDSTGDGDGEGSGGDNDGSGGGDSGSGGDDSGSGGDDGGDGGGNSGSGGHSGDSCPGMDGAFMIDNGYASNHTVCGPVFTASGGYDEVMLPIEFVGNELCTHGLLPPINGSVVPYLQFIMDVQTYPNGNVRTWSATGLIGLRWNPGGLTGPARISIYSNGKAYCLEDATPNAAYALGDFAEECWEPGIGAVLTEGTPVNSIALTIMATDVETEFDDFCLTNVVTE